ncbi:hypothetical protein KCP75_07630 [Salmonella enterica subsp. enterica]|nr:hypothetical protein KCP75_07630 [Salmonella enterica subsp. enterica]
MAQVVIEASGANAIRNTLDCASVLLVVVFRLRMVKQETSLPTNLITYKELVTLWLRTCR